MMINEELLGAYLEGNLDAQEMAQVQDAIAADSELQDIVDDVYLYDDDMADVTAADYGWDVDKMPLPEVVECEAVEAELIDEPELELVDDVAFDGDDEAYSAQIFDAEPFADDMPSDIDVDFDGDGVFDL